MSKNPPLAAPAEPATKPPPSEAAATPTTQPQLSFLPEEPPKKRGRKKA